MNTNQPQKQNLLDILAILARWFLGGVFIYMGLNKALNVGDFAEIIRQYDMVRSPVVLNSIAATLPWFEVFCGMLLLTGVAVRGTALMLLVMLVPFTLIVLKHGLALAATQAKPFCAVKFDCGCGGGEVVTCHKLAENCALIFLSAWLLTGRGRQLCARFSVAKAAPYVPPGSATERPFILAAKRGAPPKPED